MPITIDPTPGSASANSYVTLADAESYFAERLGATAWTDQGNAELKKAALVTAARRLNAEIYRGNRVSPDQALAFPRTGLWYGGQPLSSDTIPTLVQQAQMEEALALLAAAGPDGDKNPLGATGLEPFKSLGVGDIRLDMRDRTPDDPSTTLLSPVAYAMLRAYLLTNAQNLPQGTRNVRLLRS